MSSFFKNLTRGGQVVSHDVSMFKQVLLKLWNRWVLIGILVVSIFSTGHFSQPVTLSRGSDWAIARFFTQFSFLNDHKIKVRTENGNLFPVPVHIIVKDTFFKKEFENLIRNWVINLLLFLFGYLGLNTLILMWFNRKGEMQSMHRHIRGARLGSPEEVKKQLKKTVGVSDLKIGGVPIIKGYENRHFLIHGSTGVGKTQGMCQMFDHVRKKGQRAIILDEKGGFIEKYYDPKRDIILNPLDDRGANWGLWKDCRDLRDFINLAESMLPAKEDGHDPFWNRAARLVFSHAAFCLAKSEKESVSNLLTILLNANIEKLKQLIAGTSAESLMSSEIEKTALCIRAVLAMALDSLKYIEDSENPFSIRDWIKEEEKDGFLFISTTKESYATLRPLMSTWFNTIIKSVLSLPENVDRRLWLFLDEVSNLHRLHELELAVSEGRDRGLCMVFAMQNITSLQAVYGRYVSLSMLDNCNTAFFFRSNRKDAAKWASDELGESEVEEVYEGISYGASSMRDGVTLNRNRVIRNIVHFHTIQSLKDNQAYLLFNQGFPVCRVTIPYQYRGGDQDGFSPKVFKKEQRELFELIEHHKQEVPSEIKKEFHALHEHPVDKMERLAEEEEEKQIKEKKEDFNAFLEKRAAQAHAAVGKDDRSVDDILGD